MIVFVFAVEVEPHRLVGRHVVDTHFHLMACLAGHRIVVGVRLGYALCDVDLRIAGHHALVHAVEGELLPVGTPERTLLDAELVAMHALPVHDVVGAVGAAVVAHLSLLAVGCQHVEVPLQGVGQVAAYGVPVLILCSLGHGLAPCCLVGCEIHQHALFRTLAEHERLSGVGELQVVCTASHIPASPAFQVVGAEESFARQQVFHFVGRSLQCAVAPPLCEAVFGLQLPVRATSAEQVVQREALLCV